MISVLAPAAPKSADFASAPNELVRRAQATDLKGAAGSKDLEWLGNVS